MDFFGQLVDDLIEMAEDVERRYPVDGAKVLGGLKRVIALAEEAETIRYERGERAAAAARAALAAGPAATVVEQRSFAGKPPRRKVRYA